MSRLEDTIDEIDQAARCGLPVHGISRFAHPNDVIFLVKEIRKLMEENKELKAKLAALESVKLVIGKPQQEGEHEP